ncbi:Calx-beta domain-containing protein [Oscillatoria laete-virens NRMC-F 0139]|nr:Calx-beta domain-containing protein [Oscillatoria laete-virens]MDL5054125.1 Calx-beta domain-containing protein [Oscillatoria laete-virens NRMC-F 0139]
MNVFWILCVTGCLTSTLAAADVSGQINRASGVAIGSRITFFKTDLSYFREARSGLDGRYQFLGVPDGAYRLGVALRNLEYQEVDVVVAAASVTRSFMLLPETNPGRWSIVGNTSPENLQGTGSATLLPSGEAFWCHDTVDPVAFDPWSGATWFAPTSGTAQGCHVSTLQPDGDAFFTGGSMGGLPQSNVVRTSEVYRRPTNSWTRLADMNRGRWYPGIVRLPSSKLLVIAGEHEPDGYGRTNTCEIYDPVANTWANTGSLNLGTEMPPTIVLYNGEVLTTWRYPSIYNIGSGNWRPAATMLQERLGAALGDHCEHEIQLLEDGRVMAIGIRPMPGNTNPIMVEIYDPGTNTWSYGPNPRHVRMRPETARLPDGRVLTFGGEYTGPAAAAPVLKNSGQVPSCTNVADLYDPAFNTWRPLANANRWTHYHCTNLLVPDGRVITTAGAGTGGSAFGDDTSIEAFEPPYLFRGVRPSIDALSTTDLSAGETFAMTVSRTNAVTQVLMLSAKATTHWIDTGPQRYLPLAFTQNGSQVQATVPSDSVKALPGWYLLMVLVDDIPSIARMVRITTSVNPPAIPALPTVSISSLDANGSEAGPNTVTFTVTRPSGNTTAPLTVFYDLSGTAINATDINPLSGFVTIPVGSAFATVSVTPNDDLLVEGNETLTVTLSNRVNYNVAVGSSNVTLTIADNDSAPLPVVAFQTASSLGSEATTPVAIPVTLSANPTQAVTVNYSVAAGTAQGADFTAATGSLTFNPGDSLFKSISVTIANDTLPETDETVVVTLSNPMNATLGASQHIYTIKDNDLPVVRFSAASSSVQESTGATMLAVTLSVTPVQSVTVNYQVTGGTAINGAGTDFVLVPGQITFAVGETSKSLSVSVNDDSLDENNETVLIGLSNPVGAVLGTPDTHALTILDNDALPQVAFEFETSSRMEDGAIAAARSEIPLGNAVGIEVQLSAVAGRSVSVDYAITSGTATDSEDYNFVSGRLTFSLGQGIATIPLDVIPDLVFEPDETVVITLSNPISAVVGIPNSHTHTILNDDAQPNSDPVLQSPPTATPNPAVTGQAVAFSVNAVDPNNDPLTYTWTFGDGSSASGAVVTHSYVVPNTYTATVTVSDSLGTAIGSVTITINSGGGSVPPGQGPNDDFDADGLTNGTDNDDDGDGEFDSFDADPFTKFPMTVMKLQGSMKFGKAGKDFVRIQGILPGLPELFDPKNARVAIDVGGAKVDFALNAKGLAKGKSGSIRLKLKFVKSKITKKKEFKGGDVPFVAKLLAGTWSDDWADEGVNPSISEKAKPMSIVVDLPFAGKVYTATVPTVYSSKATKGARFKK